MNWKRKGMTGLKMNKMLWSDMVETLKRTEFEEALHALAARATALQDQSPVRKVKNQAAEAFAEVGVPTIRHEEWKYTNVSPILKTDFRVGEDVLDAAHTTELKKVIFDSAGAVNIVFVNGILNSALSFNLSEIKDVVLLPLREALEHASESAFAAEYFSEQADLKKYPFYALNTATSEEGIYIRIPKNISFEKPICIHHISVGEAVPVFFQLRHLIIAEENSQVSFTEHFAYTGSEPVYGNTVTEIICKAESRVHYHKLQFEKGEDTFHTGVTTVRQEAKSRFSAHTIATEGRIVRNDLNVVLGGERCEAHLWGLTLLNEKNHVDHHTLVDHAVPHCESNELYKQVLGGRSTGVFNGKIIVRPDAQKTNAFQSNKTILLSDNAVMNTKPQLEIFADDVKCSHGATTGKPNEEALFYLRSRGISLERAKALLTTAFAEEIVEKITYDALRQYVHNAIQEKLQNYLAD